MSSSNAKIDPGTHLRLLHEREEEAAERHHEMWRAFDAPERWIWEQELTIARAKTMLHVLTHGTVHADSGAELCAELDQVERLISHVREQVNAARVAAARDAQLEVYRRV